MSIEKKLDTTWYQYGYIIGANSRKKLKDLPNKIVNLGDRGISKIPNENQKVSFFIGLLCGRGKIVQNFDVVRLVQYQDRNPHKSKGDYLFLEIGKKYCPRGSTVTIPVYIGNNTVDNRGYCGYQTKITFDNTHLTLNSVQPYSQSFSFSYQQDAGVLLVQGIRDNVGYEDEILFTMEFTVNQSASDKEMLYMSGPSGKGIGSDLFTKIGGELYYIQPLTLNNGYITTTREEEQRQRDNERDEEKQSGSGDNGAGDSDDVYEDFDFEYDFDLDLSYGGNPSGGGGGSGSGGNMVVEIEIGGIVERVYIPVSDGSHHYKGKTPVHLPSLKKGPVIIRFYFEPNDEDDIYYWFVKAGALWGFETTIEREKVEDIPIPENKVVKNGFLRIYDHCLITYYAPPTPVGPTEISITDKLNTIIDMVGDISSWSESELEARGEELNEIIDGVVDGGSWSESSESESDGVGVGGFFVIEYYENEV